MIRAKMLLKDIPRQDTEFMFNCDPRLLNFLRNNFSYSHRELGFRAFFIGGSFYRDSFYRGTCQKNQ